MTPTGRASRLGTPLNCVLCDRKTIPGGYTAYRQTPVFNSTTVPTGLRHQHATKTGIWGIIHVVSGTLIYRIYHPFDSEETLDSKTQGIVLPEVEHDVQPTENAEFYVEFWRQSETSPQ